MISAKQLRKTFSVVLMICGLLIGTAFISIDATQAFAQPLVAASMEGVKADSVKAYQNLQDKTQDYRHGDDTLPSHQRAGKIINETIDRRSQVSDDTWPVQAGSQNDSRGNKDENVFQKVADNVREKLNLDEPIPDSTKEFLNDVEQGVSKVVPH